MSECRLGVTGVDVGPGFNGENCVNKKWMVASVYACPATAQCAWLLTNNFILLKLETRQSHRWENEEEMPPLVLRIPWKKKLRWSDCLVRVSKWRHNWAGWSTNWVMLSRKGSLVDRWRQTLSTLSSTWSKSNDNFYFSHFYIEANAGAENKNPHHNH